MKLIQIHRRSAAVAMAVVSALSANAALGAGNVVMSQIYGGGGNSGATLTNDYVELFNRSSSPVSLTGWCVQYASATGNFSTANTTNLSGTIAAGGYYLVQLAAGAGGTQTLPTPDATGGLALASGAGKLVLLNTNCSTVFGAGEALTDARVADFVGYGSTASRFEGAGATATLTNTLAAFRRDAGCTDGDSNVADFTTASPVPRNSSTAINTCSGGGGGGVSLRIREIQGSAHLSAHAGDTIVDVPGIVTAVSSNGFFMQDATPDADVATSEGIFVFTSNAPAVQVGDAVLVSATVNEYRPGGSGGTNNLTITELVGPTLVVQSSGNALPAAVIIGSGGRIPPAQIIDNDSTDSVENSGSFDATTDGIDFYESLEGMRVQLNNAVAVGPTSDFGEIPVVGDNGSLAGVRSARGGLVIANTDFNPERVIVDDTLAATPTVNVGDTASSIVGVMDYSFGNFKLLAATAPLFSNNGLSAEVTNVALSKQLSIASFNVENLDPSDGAAKFNALASQVVSNLRSPDIVALMEIQDSNGATNDAVVSADTTFSTLIAAIAAAGGPTYQFRQINPMDDQDGGEPGGNIRVGYLFNPARVSFVDRMGGTSTTAVSVVAGSNGAELSVSPGRINPTHAAFNNSRKPLAGEFVFNGHKLFLIANHFNSKGGDEPLFGHQQPPVRSSEIQRTAQASIVANFVQTLQAVQADAKIVVLGDLNDFEFSDTLTIVKNAGMVDLVETLPASERYTYVFDGNSQVLDHILVSNALHSVAASQYDVVHVNSEFAAQVSDHEPEVVRLTLAPSDVSAQVSVYRSGLVFNRSTQTYNGTLQLTNNGAAINGPIQVRIEGLPAGVTLANAMGNDSGFPYITAGSSTLAAGAQLSVPVRFNNPGKLSFTYTARVLTGHF